MFFDYDGVLIHRGSKNEDTQAAAVLARLAQNQNNEVWVVSARSITGIRHLRGVDGLNLAGEHGTVTWRAGEGQPTLHRVEGIAYFRDMITNMAQAQGLRRLKFMDTQNSIVFTYKEYDHETVANFLASIQSQVNYPGSNFEMRSKPESRYVEVKPKNLDKGDFVAEILQNGQYGFALSMGDEGIDEGMHHAINAWGHSSYLSVVVSTDESQRTCARAKLDSAARVRSYLEYLSQS